MAEQDQDVPAEPHQPLTFAFPKRSFGKKNAVLRSFQLDWFSKWPFLHYNEAKDAAFCHEEQKNQDRQY